MNEKTEKALLDYITEQHLTEESKNIIYHFCQNRPKQKITVYRAHTKSKEIRPALWFSTSKNKNAVKDFAGETCCTFTIHLKDVPCINVNAVLPENRIKRYMDEEEVIVLGGGIFYRDVFNKKKGFLDVGNGNFECWYSMDTSNSNEKININNDVYNENMNMIERALNIIPEEEYEFINTIDDIDVSIPLTDEQKKEVLFIIKQHNETNKGGFRIMKKRKTKKQKKRKGKTQKQKKRKGKTKKQKKYFKIEKK